MRCKLCKDEIDITKQKSIERELSLAPTDPMEQSEKIRSTNCLPCAVFIAELMQGDINGNALAHEYRRIIKSRGEYHATLEYKMRRKKCVI